MAKNIAVVGAGPAGLITAYQLGKSGHTVTIFEGSNRSGGIYADYAEKPFYRDLHLTSSRRMTEFSIYPAPKTYYDFMTLDQAASYFQDFGKAHNLDIRYGQRVSKVALIGDDAIELSFASGKTAFFDHAIVCSGIARNPNIVDPYEDFTGETIHSDSIPELSEFKGKRVLIKGVGETTLYVIGRLSEVAERIVVVSRRGFNLVPRTLVSVPLDLLFFWQLRPYMPRFFHDFISLGGTNVGEFKWLDDKLGDSVLRNAHRIPHVKHRHSFGTEFSRKYFWGLSENGKYYDNLEVLRLKHDIQFSREILSVDEKKVRLAEGKDEEIDVIIHATGFIPIPSVELPVQAKPNFYTQLYKGIMHPSLGDRILFNGLTRPNLGSFSQMAEMSSLMIDQIIDGTYRPTTSRMFDVMLRDQLDRTSAAPILADRPNIQEFRVWMEAMAELLGRRAKLKNVGFNPIRLMAFLIGPHIMHRYNLDERGRFEDEYIDVFRALYKTISVKCSGANALMLSILFCFVVPLSIVGAFVSSPWWLLAPLGVFFLTRLATIKYILTLLKYEVRDYREFGVQYKAYEVD